MNNKKDLRMVVLVPYNLSGIQKGIQASHAIVEYSLNTEYLQVGSITLSNRKEYNEWANLHKTIIVLNGGTTGNNSTLQQHKYNLDALGVQYSIFHEPDLNDALTAIAFIVDYNNDKHIVQYLRSMNLA